MENSLSSVARISAQRQIEYRKLLVAVEANGLIGPERRLPGSTFHPNVCFNFKYKFTCSYQIVTFVQESSRAIEAGEAAVDSEENGTSREIDAVNEDNVSVSHPASHNISVEAPFFHHTPATDHCTLQEQNVSLFNTNQSESEPLEKVLASYLLRHFKQEPGQWCVLMSFLNSGTC